VLISFPFASERRPRDDAGPLHRSNDSSLAVTHAQIGATWGLATIAGNLVTPRLYEAFTTSTERHRRHLPRLRRPDDGDALRHLTDLRRRTAGADPHDFSTPATPARRPGGGRQYGTGGMDVSEDGSRVDVMNLPKAVYAPRADAAATSTGTAYRA